MFIVIEGPDQVGKTEQARRLVEYLAEPRTPGRLVLVPVAGPLTGRIARAWLGDQECVNAGRRPGIPRPAVTFQCVQLVDKYAAVPAIERALRGGTDVVCCRWWQSAYAYGLDEGLPRGSGSRHLQLTCRYPADLNLLINLDPSIAL